MSKFLIVGLGNIGEEYVNTRHNIGFMVLDTWAQKENVKFTVDRLASVTQIRHKGKIFVLVKPSTFMNLSGKAVNYWLQAEKLTPRNMLVIADDIALPIGALRMKNKGSDGGHNGLKDIIATLNSTEFPRLRIGVGNEFPKGGQSDYVLGKWSEEEIKILNPRIEMAVEMIKSFGTIGVDRTMSSFNNK